MMENLVRAAEGMTGNEAIYASFSMLAALAVILGVAWRLWQRSSVTNAAEPTITEVAEVVSYWATWSLRGLVPFRKFWYMPMTRRLMRRLTTAKMMMFSLVDAALGAQEDLLLKWSQ